MKKKLVIGLFVAVILSFSLTSVCFAANYVVYDTRVWTEFGYTVQRYIGSATNIGIRIFAVVFGIGLVAGLIKSISGVNKND